MNFNKLEYSQFIEIQNLKAKGFNKTQTYKKLNLTEYSVRKFWDMSKEDFQENYCGEQSMYDKHEEFIVNELKQNPYIATATLYDHLVEVVGEVGGTMSTWYRYMKKLRIREGCWHKGNHKPRLFCVQADRLAGTEAQVDMGELWMKDFDGEKVKVYFFAMVLSYSRIKYVYFSIEPFSATLFCYAHDRAFRYFGGRPKEIWYDQDKVMVVSENCGEIIFTKDFEEYRNAVGFEIMLCRKQDPDTKGKVENVIRYVKMNFLDGREYGGIDSLNSACLGWLDRTGNGTMNANTKKVPRGDVRRRTEISDLHSPKNYKSI